MISATSETAQVTGTPVLSFSKNYNTLQDILASCRADQNTKDSAVIDKYKIQQEL